MREKQREPGVGFVARLSAAAATLLLLGLAGCTQHTATGDDGGSAGVGAGGTGAAGGPATLPDGGTPFDASMPPQGFDGGPCVIAQQGAIAVPANVRPGPLSGPEVTAAATGSRASRTARSWRRWRAAGGALPRRGER